MLSIRTAIVVLGCLAFTGCATDSTQDDEPAIHEEVRPAFPEGQSKKLIRAAQKYVKRYQEGQNIRDLDKALDALRNAERLEPDDPGVNGLLYAVMAEKATAQLDEALLEELKGPYDVAFRYAPTYARNLPHPSRVAAEIYWRISAREGLSTEQETAYEDKAIKALREAVRDRPADARAHYMLARAYYHRDLNELALFEAQEAVRLAPESAGGHYLLGKIHRDNVHRDDACYDRAAVDAAVRAYKEAIRLAPAWPHAHRRLSVAFVHQGRFELAVFQARQAVELHDSALKRATLGYTLLSAGRPEEAVKEFNEALKQSSEHAWAQQMLPLALFVARRYDEAIAAYGRYLEDRDSPSIYAVLYYHLALRHLGRDEEAHRLLARHAGQAEKPWEEDLLAFYSGTLSPAQLRARAENDCQRSGLLFYMGYERLLEDRTEEARRGFEAHLRANYYCYGSTYIARARLTQLGEPKR